MAKQVFTWLPEFSATNTEEPAVKTIKFGDGYEARVSDTINVNRQSWSLTFTEQRLKGQVSAIRAFLRQHRGVLSFTWTSPLNETGSYVARKWTVSTEQGFLTIKVTFDEVFEQ
jgi:phage-related protein